MYEDKSLFASHPILPIELTSLSSYCFVEKMGTFITNKFFATTEAGNMTKIQPLFEHH